MLITIGWPTTYKVWLFKWIWVVQCVFVPIDVVDSSLLLTYRLGCEHASGKSIHPTNSQNYEGKLNKKFQKFEIYPKKCKRIYSKSNVDMASSLLSSECLMIWSGVGLFTAVFCQAFGYWFTQLLNIYIFLFSLFWLKSFIRDCLFNQYIPGFLMF